MEFTHSMVGHTASVNCLSLQTEPSYAEQDRDYVISAGGDGVWIKWDMATQSKVLQGGAAGRHKALACVTWSVSQVNCILTNVSADRCIGPVHRNR